MRDSYRPKASEAAWALYRDALVWDMTLPWVPGFNDAVTLPRFQAAGIKAISLTVNDFTGGIQGTIRNMAQVRAAIDAEPRFAFCRTVDDILAAAAAGRLALWFHHQETNALDGNLHLVQTYYDLGVRHMLLAYNQKNRVGDGCAEPTDAGLSNFGVRLIAEMNRVGMMVDGSHSGYRTTMHAMEVCQGPFIFSHTNAMAVCQHYRCVRDDQIKACARSGGVMGVTGMGSYLYDLQARSESIFAHVDYIAGLVGPEHVAIGLDYVRDVPTLWNWVRALPDAWPLNQGKPHVDTEFGQPEQIVEIVELMLQRGWREGDVRGWLGGNWVRVARQVWK